MNFDIVEGLNNSNIEALYDDVLISCYCYCDSYNNNIGDIVPGKMCENYTPCMTNCVSGCKSRYSRYYDLSRCGCYNPLNFSDGRMHETFCYS